jgi:hypothetical protein
MKKVIPIIAGIVALVLFAAGGFWAGTVYQKNLVSQAQTNFFAARGRPPAGAPDGQFTGGQGMLRGGTTGEVKALDGNTLTLSTSQDVTAIKLSADTVISKTATGDTTDLQPGVRVMVRGQADDSGTITAEQITILDGTILDGDARFLPGAIPPTAEP